MLNDNAYIVLSKRQRNMSYEGEGRFIGKVRVKKKTQRKKKKKKERKESKASR